jgi:uncharacterized protein YciI
VGIREDGHVEVLEGLKDNERVVTTGAFGLGDGTKIKIVQGEEKKDGAAEKTETKKDEK